jgi:hypothetical protein
MFSAGDLKDVLISQSRGKSITNAIAPNSTYMPRVLSFEF